MTPIEHRCGTCRWYTGRPDAQVAWDCSAPFPDCAIDDERQPMHADEGADCPVWQPHGDRP